MEEFVRRPIRWSALLAVVGLAVSGCSGGSTATTLPTTPTTTPPTTTATITQTFTGNLNINGAATLPFTTQAGTVTATLTALGDPAVTVGLALGTWSGTSCVIAIASDTSLVGATVTGTSAATSNVCVRIYDVGFLTATIPFTITITHP